MATAEYNRVFVIGSDAKGNKQLVHVPAGEDSDLPATAEFYYEDSETAFS